jgi:hypothetical protein
LDVSATKLIAADVHHDALDCRSRAASSGKQPQFPVGQ